MSHFADWLERVTFYAALLGFPTLALFAYVVLAAREIQRRELQDAADAQAALAASEAERQRNELARLNHPLFRYERKTGGGPVSRP